MDPYEKQITILKALGHPGRLAILEALRQEEACVCHLEALFGWRQAYISQQLTVLRDAGLISDRRDGWNIYYRVAKPGIFAVLDGVDQLSERTKRPASRPAPKNCTCPHCLEKAPSPSS